MATRCSPGDRVPALGLEPSSELEELEEHLECVTVDMKLSRSDGLVIL